MAIKTRAPRLGTGAARNVGLDGLDTSKIASHLLDRQARRLTVRFPITLAIARVVAELHFAAGRSA